MRRMARWAGIGALVIAALTYFVSQKKPKQPADKRIGERYDER